jgi:hypothetical protein
MNRRDVDKFLFALDKRKSTPKAVIDFNPAERKAMLLDFFPGFCARLGEAEYTALMAAVQAARPARS